MDTDWNACLQTFEGHSSWVSSVAFSATGQLASASYDRTVKLWDPASGACLQTFEGHSGSVSSVVFSATGQLASASDDGIVKLWDPASGACLQTFEGHSNTVSSVVFSATGQLASASDDHTVKLWDPASGACLQTFEGHNSWVRSVAFSATGQLASASDDHTVKLWDPASGACLQTFEGHGNTVAFDPIGDNLLTRRGRIAKHPFLRRRSIAANAGGGPQPPIQGSSCGIDAQNRWVTYDGENKLWLPPDYRPGQSAIYEKTIAIGYRSGRVLIIGFA
jgi:hypothetical protein